MAVFRVAKNSNYTVMSNYHLRDTTCMKSYLITALYNSLKTISHYYDAWVNHDEAQYCQNGDDG